MSRGGKLRSPSTRFLASSPGTLNPSALLWLPVPGDWALVRWPSRRSGAGFLALVAPRYTMHVGLRSMLCSHVAWLLVLVLCSGLLDFGFRHTASALGFPVCEFLAHQLAIGVLV